ncbi:helix-turn-helix domain-containing protein [Actinoplanes sp. TBRC 11911]|uniref:helix-turn-helix transcriptional regulator n=1 Tax=Actinoplanes sp. TBRC 11911 TaxID=2729386 RepID=UPI00145E7FFC|nr:LuxR family transcriptional regulator [Actinoplanes sp. TBRC 11911]NMO56852.1 helix-turn-helix domain-containing protein [Actinoplanes sp. TBRC 11911]
MRSSEAVVDADAVLVGREAEWQGVSAFLDAALPSGRALIISGELGAGKTAMLTAARADAEARGARVLVAAGSPHQQMNDFTALARLLAPVEDRLDVLPEQLGAALAGVLGLGPAAPAGPMLVGNATLLLLRAIADERPVLLVADDMHRMDEPSASTIAFVARRLHGTRVAVLGAVNVTQCGPADLYGFPRQELPALSGEAVDELLSRRFPRMAAGVRNRIRSESRGNPYAALSFAGALTREQESGDTPLPAVLTIVPAPGDVLADRLGFLPADTQRALLVAALNDSGDLRVLNAACPYGRALAVLEPAERARLVTIDEERQRLEFAHPLIRSVIVARAPGPARRRAHHALASVLSGTDSPRAAAHLAEAASGPDDAVGGALEQAALVYLGSGRPRAAFTAMSRAAELTASPELRRSRQAKANYLDVLMVSVRTGARPDVPELLVGVIAQAYRESQRDPAAACRLVAGALRDAVNPPPPIVRESLQSLVTFAVMADQPGLWTEFEDVLVRYADLAPASVRIFAGAFGPGFVDATLADVDAFLDDIRHEFNPAIVLRSGLALTYLSRLSGTREQIARCVTEGEADGAVGVAQRARSILALDAWASGMWDEGVRVVARAGAVSEQMGYISPNSPLFPAVRGLIAAARGECEISAESVAELDVWAGRRHNGFARQFADHIRCLGALSAGDAEAAYRHATATGGPGELRPYRPHAAWLVLDLVESAVRSGRRDEAAAHVEALRGWSATPLSARLPFVLAGCEAMVADDVEATALFERAVTAPEAQQWPFDLGRIELAYGDHLRSRRDMRGARLHLTNALRWFHRLDALPWANRAAELLRATGSSVTEPVPAAALSPVELRIATLAAAGLTNKQIGDKLFLSGRTVGTYLHGMFPKLGVSSRAALADALANCTTEFPEPALAGDRA